jgi:hypothetical protein
MRLVGLLAEWKRAYGFEQGNVGRCRLNLTLVSICTTGLRKFMSASCFKGNAGEFQDRGGKVGASTSSPPANG